MNKKNIGWWNRRETGFFINLDSIIFETKSSIYALYEQPLFPNENTSDWFKAGMNSLISLLFVDMFFGSSQNSLGGVVGVTKKDMGCKLVHEYFSLSFMLKVFELKC